MRLLSLTLLLAVTSAHAGSLQNGSWRPSNCGDEPVAPHLDSSTKSGYAESIRWVKSYEAAIKTYDDCLLKEANEDSDTIHSYVEDEQARVKTAFDGYNAASKSMSNGASQPDDTPHKHRSVGPSN